MHKDKTYEIAKSYVLKGYKKSKSSRKNNLSKPMRLLMSACKGLKRRGIH